MTVQDPCYHGHHWLVELDKETGRFLRYTCSQCGVVQVPASLLPEEE